MANEKKRGIKRIFSAMMAAAVAASTVFSAMPLTAVAEYSGGIIDDTDGKFYAAEVTGATSAEWDGTVATGYAGGTGTEADPYQIATGEQLAYLAQQVDEGNDYKGVYFKLTADILLNDDIGDEPNEWDPIGGYDGTGWDDFAGTFDGANHKVIGMYINDTRTDDFGHEKGLFSRISSNGTVKNVGVTDGRMVCGGQYVGGICGYNNGTISNCYNTVKISNSSSEYGNYGGICGWNANIGTIEDSYNTGELYLSGEADHLGGVCGYNKGGSISGCYNSGKVYSTTATNFYIGGVCGYNSKGTVTDCYNKGDVNGYQYTGGVCAYNGAGTVEDSHNVGTISGGYMYTGGVCGYSCSSDASDVVQRCFNTGKVINTHTDDTNGYTGGVCGYLSGYLIQECYNKGAVTTNGTYQTAGICGYVNKGEIRECYNSGAVTSACNTTGGIAGYLNSNCVVENCYNTGAVKGDAVVGGIWGASNSSYNVMTNCYNIGSVSGNSTIRPVGEKEGKIANVYYDSDVVTTSDTTNADYARTTEQLTAETVLDDLGFTASGEWSKKDNGAMYWYYPDLKAIDGDQPQAFVGIPVPTGLKATAGNRSVKLTWDRIDDADRYAVYKYVDGKYTTVTSTVRTNSYTVTGLTNGVKVGFKVKVYFNGVWSDASNIVYATPKASAPTNVRAVAGNSKATVTWDAVDGAARYAVYIYRNGVYTCLNSQIKTTSYTATGLTNGVKVGFKVKAHIDQWSGASAMAYATPASPVPTGVRAVAGNKKATVTWDAVAGATKYAVYLYDEGVYTCLSSNVTGTSYTATGLTNGRKIGFKIKAYVNNAWSGASSIAYCTPVDPVPSGVTATGGDTTATITWNKVAGAERYAVYIYKDGKYTCLDSRIKSNSYTVTDLENGVKVGFKVKAYINGAWSGASAIAWATPNA